MDTLVTNSSHKAHQLARVLHELSPVDTRLALPTKTYVALRAPQSGYVGANIYKSFAWFYLDVELKQELEDEGLNPEIWKQSSGELRDKNKFRIRSLSVEDVLNHKDLFSRILRHSITVRDSIGNQIGTY